VAEPIDDATTLRRNPAVLWRKVLDGVLLLAPGQHEPVHITTPGDLLWDGLASPATPAELAHRLAERHDAPEHVIRTDIEGVLLVLIEIGAIRVHR
jgi:hypothetical protein